jgi:Short C-terminal domain
VPPQVTVHPEAVVDFSPTLDLRNDPELRRKIEAVVGHELRPGQTLTVAENDPGMQQRILQVIQEHRVGTDDRTSQLERLAALRDSGALTEAEFAAAKAKVLGGQ